MTRLQLTSIASFLVILITNHSYAQFVSFSGTNHIYNTNSGNVGIGLNTPLTKLHVKSEIIAAPYNDELGNPVCSGISALRIEGYSAGQYCSPNAYGNYFEIFLNENSSQTQKFVIDHQGFVGIGDNLTPLSKFDVDGAITMRTGATSGYIPISDANGTMSWTDPSSLGLGYWSASGQNIYNSNSGDVIIGSQTGKTGYKLSVEGKIVCEEVKVELHQNWDAVFRDGYKLMSLQEIESYISLHQHLPHIPSGKQLKEEGVSLSEMNSHLLRTVEELTLHIIELEKRIANLEEDE